MKNTEPGRDDFHVVPNKSRPLISLCMIVGNVEEYILRCLESFHELADEIILVRAIGNQKPDKTITKAREFCAAKGIHFKAAVYENKSEHADWPHVDDFAAARQMSFDLADGEYCFWVDSDDVLDQTPTLGRTPAQIVRELAARGGFPCVIMPYKIFGRGVSVPRERMIQKSAGRWRYAVHECFDFHVKQVRAIEDARVVVTHLPHLSKSGSGERNLRILESIKDEELSPGLMYHLQGELAMAGRTADSIKMAERALKSQGLGRPERYEIFLNLAQMATHPDAKHTMLQQAYAADPRRREAIGLLACHAMDYGHGEEALAYARQMMATLPPVHTEWNNRAAVYGWLGEDIYSQALRFNGLYREAEIIRREVMNRVGGPRIALIHATRGRPQKASAARKIWLDLAEKPEAVEHIFILDEDDEASQALTRMHHIVVPPGGGCVRAWNAGAEATAAQVIVQFSDDWTPVPQWDRLLLERIGDVKQPRVLAIGDGFRADQLLCMAICTREYLHHDYFFFHPDFLGVYSDNWFTELAYRRGAVIEARDLVFSHDHPFKTGKDLDRTYEVQNSPERYTQGQGIMRRLQSGNDWSSVPGFYNYWQLYQAMAGRLKDGDTIAEIGVWCGRSIIHLAQMLKTQGKRVKIYAVDHFKGESNQPEHEATIKHAGGNLRATFEANLQRCGVADMVEILEGDSAEMAARVADSSLAFCYIDAAHDYDSVKRDIAAWSPKIKPGGVLAGHDAQHEPVIRAVKESFPEAFTSQCIWTSTKENPIWSR